MRDFVIITLVLVGCLSALRQPWYGVLVWVWLSLMNPHRYSYGPAYDAPLAAMAVATTMIGLAVTKDKLSPFKQPPMVMLSIFVLWLTASWALGLDPEDDYDQWKKVVKVYFMVFVSLALIIERKQILVFSWVTTASLAILGMKGGIFTVITGGSYRVWGPPDTFIEDNNEFALALIMTVPLMRFLQTQSGNVWVRRILTVGMLLLVASGLGSYSRGALLASLAMSAVIWWRGTDRLRNAVVFVVVGLLLVGFMPEQWGNRMSTIETYEQDDSAMGRISAWWTAFNYAKDHLLGAGFNLARPDLFAKYSPLPESVHAAHSIYFQVLGNHGFVGLFWFLMIGALTWKVAADIRRISANKPELSWCYELGGMCQCSMVSYAVGGAFLSLAYFDLPYYVMVMLLATRRWLTLHGHDKPKSPIVALR